MASDFPSRYRIEESDPAEVDRTAAFLHSTAITSMKQSSFSQTPDGGFFARQSVLSVPFAVLGGRIIIGVSTRPGESLGRPIEIWEHLFWEQGKQITKITSLAQLRGKVRIYSPEGALAFVRLPSAPETSYLFPSINNTEQIDVVDSSKDPRYRNDQNHDIHQHGFYGTLNHKEYQGLKIPDVVYRPCLGGFLVERPVVFFYNRKPVRMVIVRQIVSNDGALRERPAHDLGPKVLAAHHWFLPTFE